MSLTPDCVALSASSPSWIPLQTLEGGSRSGLVRIAGGIYTVRTATC